MKMADTQESLDTELNLIPIIDCFVMLICFLLFTAAFTQLVYLETKITANTAAAMNKSRNELDKFQLEVFLRDNGYEVKLSGSAVQNRSFTVAKLNGNYDYEKLHLHLVDLKARHPDRFSVDVAIKAKNKSAITYRYVLKTIDAVRHLTDQEYALMRTAEKKVQSLELTDEEKAREIPDLIIRLAEGIVGNKVAANADPKVLFPDIALTGVF